MKKVWLFLVFLACFLISLVYDKKIILMITQNHISLLNGFMVWLTKLPVTITIFLLVTIRFLCSRRRRLAIPLWISIMSTAAITIILKIIISKPRPFEILTFPLIQGAKYTFDFWNTSFPSLHAAVFFSLFPIIGKGFPKLKWLWVILASLIAFSRLYIGVHYLSDVLLGCFIGLAVGYGILHAEKKFKLFKKWTKKKSWK